MLTATAIVAGINILTEVLKKFIYPRFGAFGVQMVAYILAFIAAVYIIYGGNIPGIKEVLVAAGLLFSTAITVYEVLLKNIPYFGSVKTE